MGIFDSDEESDEVQISPDDQDSGREGKLRNEVESKVVPDGGEEESTDSRVSGVASGSRVSDSGSSGDIGVEDVYRQNERIIELLEELAGDGNNGNNGEKSESQNENSFDGDLNGVL